MNRLLFGGFASRTILNHRQPTVAAAAGLFKSNCGNMRQMVRMNSSSATSTQPSSGVIKHWKAERVVSVALLPLTLLPLLTGPNKLADYLLAFTLPVHIHMGYEQIVTDYLNPRKVGVAGNKAAVGVLYGLTALSVVGMLVFNVRDVGVSYFIRDLWHAKSNKKD